MHTHHLVLLLCNYHPASTRMRTRRGEASARPTLLTTAFAHSCCMMMVLIFDPSSYYSKSVSGTVLSRTLDDGEV